MSLVHLAGPGGAGRYSMAPWRSAPGAMKDTRLRWRDNCVIAGVPPSGKYPPMIKIKRTAPVRLALLDGSSWIEFELAVLIPSSGVEVAHLAPR